MVRAGIAATAALWLLSASLVGGQGARVPMAEEVFKNIQVLKGIPVDEFMGTMGFFSAALGMNCTWRAIAKWPGRATACWPGVPNLERNLNTNREARTRKM